MSGQSLDAYFEDHIFRPLGIKDSGLLPAELYSHARLDNGTITSSAPAPLDPNATPFGGGFLTSTLGNYSNFLLTLLMPFLDPEVMGLFDQLEEVVYAV